MKKITVDMGQGRNNFHNSRPINIIVTEKTVQGEDGRPLYIISKSQARKLDRHFCGIADCICGSGPVIEYDQDRYGISTKF